ncbi:MAG TPA: DUF4215 domain-containing protein [Candidatus Binatia bacterium]|nr:DUF4215 domain-containing protein [Candidatus Binatia bacterium]
MHGSATTTTTTTTTTLPSGVPSFLPATTLAGIHTSEYGHPWFRPALVADANGRWILSWPDEFLPDWSDSTDYGAVFSTSGDNARHWSPAQPVQNDPHTDSVEVTIATDDRGNWLMAWPRTDGEIIEFRRSTDGGVTWGERATLYLTDFTGPFHALRSIGTVAIAAGRQERWLAAWTEIVLEERTADSGNDVQIAVFCGVRASISHDAGASWGRAFTVREMACERVRNVTAAADRRGNHLIVWTDGRVMGMRSLDDARTWSSPAPLLKDAHLSPASVTVAAGGDGSWLLAFIGSVARDREDATQRVFVSRASDLLQDWSKPRGIAPWHEQPGGDDSSPSLAAGDGRWGIAWQTHADVGLDMDADVVAAFSDDGLRWGDAAPVDTGAATDVRADVNPQIVHGGAQTWGVAWRTYELTDPGTDSWTGTIRFARTRGGCGNGIQEVAEKCDDGNEVEGDGCDSNCLPTGCGNGIVTSGEECDDGNADESDACISDCRLAVCGDGFARESEESCDDGNSIETDACHADCTPAVCGDGVVWQDVEECDEARNGNDDSCLNHCTMARCGDGYLHLGSEQCDDGNLEAGDRCTKRCRLNPVCNGDVGSGQGVRASDALRVLNEAVGLRGRCPLYRCDTDRNGRITAADALQTLRHSVGLVSDGCMVPRSLVVRLATAETVGALQFILDYANAAGDITGSDGRPDCESLVPAVLTAMNWDGGRALLHVGMVTIQGFEGPADLLRCQYRALAGPSANDFGYTVVNAASPDFGQLSPVLEARLE